MADKPAYGFMGSEKTSSDFNQLDFIVRQIMGKQSTATLVLVKKVYNTGADVAVGMIDVQPMVHQTDGVGQIVEHGTINNIPYLRYQGGANAIIIDPQVGDIGICIFASHDISKVKNTQAPAAPDSSRRFDMSDGLYIGGVLNGVPNQFISFSAAGITITPLTGQPVTINGKLVLNGDMTQTGNTTTSGTITGTTDVVGGGKSLKGHKHGGVQTGSGQTGTPV